MGRGSRDALPKRMHVLTDSRARRIVKALLAQGWKVTSGRSSPHLRCVPPDPSKAIVVHSSSPRAGVRSEENWLAQLRRSGFVWEG